LGREKSLLLGKQKRLKGFNGGVIKNMKKNPFKKRFPGCNSRAYPPVSGGAVDLEKKG